MYKYINKRNTIIFIHVSLHLFVKLNYVKILICRCDSYILFLYFFVFAILSLKPVKSNNIEIKILVSNRDIYI